MNAWFEKNWDILLAVAVLTFFSIIGVSAAVMVWLRWDLIWGS